MASHNEGTKTFVRHCAKFETMRIRDIVTLSIILFVLLFKMLVN